MASRGKKIAAIIAGIIALVVVGLVVAVHLLITPERVKQTVLPLAEEALQRKLDLQDVEISIFSGIGLEGLKVYEQDGKETFASVDRVVLRYQIWPLLAGQVVVDEVRLVGPTIVVVRKADGSFNFSDIGGGEEGAVKKPVAEKAEGDKDGGLNLLVSQVALQGGQILYQDHTVGAGKPFELAVKELDVKAREISLTSAFPIELGASIGGAPLKVKGSVDPVVKGADAVISLAGLDLSLFKPFIGDGYPTHLTPLNLDIDLKAKADASIAAVNGTVGLLAGSERLKIDLAAANLLATPLKATVDVGAESLHLEKLLAPAAAVTGQTGAEAKGKGGTGKVAPSQEVGPFDLPLDLSGKVRIGTLHYNALAISDCLLKWSLKKNVFTLSQLAGKAAGGTIDGMAIVDLGRKGLTYSSGIDLKGVQADPLISAFKPKAAGTVFGGMNLNLDVEGRGTVAETLKRNLSGSGNLLLSEGKVVGAPLVEGLAAFLGNDELKVLSFKQSQTDFTIDKGRVAFDGSADGSKVRLQPSGSAGLDGSLDIRLPTRLSPELTRKVAGSGDLGQFLTDDQGWGLVPLRVKGTVSQPKFTLDSRAVKSQVKEKMRKEIEQKLLEELIPDDGSGEQEPAKKLLKDTLKGIFGN